MISDKHPIATGTSHDRTLISPTRYQHIFEGDTENITIFVPQFDDNIEKLLLFEKNFPKKKGRSYINILPKANIKICSISKTLLEHSAHGHGVGRNT